MQSTIKNALSPPTVTDLPNKRLARQLHFLILIGIPLSAIIPILLILMDATLTLNNVLSGGVFIILLLIYPILHQGYTKLAASVILTIAYFAAFMASINQGIRDPTFSILFLLLVLTSVFAGRLPTIIMGFVIGLFAIGLFWSEQAGLLQTPYPFPPTIGYIVLGLVTTTVMTLFLQFTISGIIQDSGQIQQQSLLLARNNKQLRQIQGVLEDRAQELSELNENLHQEMAERQRVETTLRQKQKLESIGLLAGGVAHDFNNLLTAMLSQSSLALYKLSSDHQARQHIEKMVVAVDRAADLTQNLLAYAGKGKFQIQPIDLNQLIWDNTAILSTAVKNNATIVLDLAKDLPSIEADKGQIQQVLMNLVINAAEAINHTEGVIKISTALTKIDDQTNIYKFTGEPPIAGEYVCLHISDNGMGMSSETKDKIFDPFFSTKDDGHGLGLSAIWGIIQSQRGGVQVETTLGEGSDFHIFIQTGQKIIPTAKKTMETPVRQPEMNGLILVIDDEEPVREAVVDILEMVELTAVTAANGNQGIELLKQHLPNLSLVLLDMQMPGMNGEETLREIRKITADLPVILSSGYSQIQFPSHLFEQELSGFLQKPYHINKMITMIQQTLQSTN